MKRSGEEASSFDLFLDTICNAFGGIVFLAILLALMVQARSVVKTEDATGEQPPTPDEIRELITQLDSLTSAHAALAETLEQTPDTSDVSDNREYRQMVQQVHQAEAKIAEMAQQNAKASRELAEQVAKNTALQAGNDKLPDELAESQKDLLKRQTDYLRSVESKQQTLRLPRSRSSTAASILVLFKEERVYLALRPGLFDRGFNTAHVTTTTLASSGIEIRPVQGAGWAIDDPAGLRQINRVIGEAAGKGFIITTAIWPDSYARFSILREKMIETNVPYQLWLQDDDSVLTVFPGSGTSRIQ